MPRSVAAGIKKNLRINIYSNKFVTDMKQSMQFLAISFCFLLSACSEKKQDNIVIKNGNVTIAYTKAGNSDTALLFVHGWAINKEYWQDQATAFSKRYTVVTMDLGGHGESGKNRASWTTDDFANDVIAVIDSLKLQKVILVGHSMGGHIILETTSKIPQKIIGFIGVDNFKDVGVTYTPQMQQQINAFVDSLHVHYKSTAVAFSRGSLFPPNYSDTASVNLVLTNVANMDSAIAIAAIESEIQFNKEKELLMQLKVPVHLIESDYRPTAADSLAKYCGSGYSIKTIHGTGHYPMIEKPKEFNQLLGETLDEISKGK